MLGEITPASTIVPTKTTTTIEASTNIEVTENTNNRGGGTASNITTRLTILLISCVTALHKYQ